MKRFTRRGLEALLAEHFELILTTAGVLMAMMLTLSELSREREMALIFVIWLQGLIIWAVHRHSRFRYHALTHNLRLMLNEMVNDRLTFMLNTAEHRTRDIPNKGEEAEATVIAAVENISLELESIRNWEQRLKLLRV
jgi:hypothetical protein